MRCPICADIPLDEGLGPLGSAICPRCAGGLFPSEGASMLLTEQLGHTTAELRELAGLVGGRRLPCPACRSAMSRLVLRGAELDLCLGCGALWLDASDLPKISGGRYELPPPRLPGPPAASNDARAALVSIPRLRSRAKPLLTAVAGWVAFELGIALHRGPAPALVLGSVIAVFAWIGIGESAVDIFPRARRLVRWSGIRRPTPKEVEGEPYDVSTMVVVRPWRLLRRALPFARVELVDEVGERIVSVASMTPIRRARNKARSLASTLGLAVRTSEASSTTTSAPVSAGLQTARVLHVEAAAVEAAGVEPSATPPLLEVRNDAQQLLAIARPTLVRESHTLTEHLEAGIHIVDVATQGEATLYFAGGHRRRTTVRANGAAIGQVRWRFTPLVSRFVFDAAGGRSRQTLNIWKLLDGGKLVSGEGNRLATVDVRLTRTTTIRDAHVLLDEGACTGDDRWGLLALLVHVACSPHT